MSVVYAYHSVEQDHSKDGHPENRRRLSSTLELLHTDGVLEKLQALEVTPISWERLERVHPREYVAAVERLANTGGGQLDPDTYVGERSFAAARGAAGALADIVDCVLGGRAQRGMSLMRPPGHHALPNRGMGFCIFANVAIAAQVARAEYGLDRVLIIDWDVHHGNGTEAVFYEDSHVGFFSTHQYPFYPGTGAVEDTGRGEGAGMTVNVPLPAGVGDTAYVQIFSEVLIPYVDRFQPQLILVSAGYDAHWRDPLAGECLTLRGFARLTQEVLELAERHSEGRVILALEGGYDTEVLPHAILNSLRLLRHRDANLSDPFGPAPDDPPLPPDLIARIREIHGL